MSENEFILWLHGFFEISNAKTLNEEQVKTIKGKLTGFFNKATPERASDPPKNWEWDKKTAPMPIIPAPANPVNPWFPKNPTFPEPWKPYWESPITCLMTC